MHLYPSIYRRKKVSFCVQRLKNEDFKTIRIINYSREVHDIRHNHVTQRCQFDWLQLLGYIIEMLITLLFVVRFPSNFFFIFCLICLLLINTRFFLAQTNFLWWHVSWFVLDRDTPYPATQSRMSNGDYRMFDDVHNRLFGYF